MVEFIGRELCWKFHFLSHQVGGVSFIELLRCDPYLWELSETGSISCQGNQHEEMGCECTSGRSGPGMLTASSRQIRSEHPAGKQLDGTPNDFRESQKAPPERLTESTQGLQGRGEPSKTCEKYTKERAISKRDSCKQPPGLGNPVPHTRQHLSA